MENKDLQIRKVIADAENNQGSAVLMTAAPVEALCSRGIPAALVYLNQTKDVNGVLLIRKESASDGKDTECAVRTVSLENGRSIQALPLNYPGIILKSEAVYEDMRIRGVQTDLAEYAKRLDVLDACRILSRKRKAGVLRLSCEEASLSDGGMFFQNWMDEGWYMETVQRCRSFLEECSAKAGAASILVQLQILGILKLMFQINSGSKDKRAFSEEGLGRFLDVCSEILSYIANDLIQTRNDLLHRERKGGVAVQTALLRLKYRGREEQALWERREYVPPVTMELMEYEQGKLRIDASVSWVFGQGKPRLEVRRNGRVIPHGRASVDLDKTFFGKRLAPKEVFFVELPYEELKRREILEIWLTDGAGEVQLPILTGNYESKLTRKLENSYWCFRDYMVMFGSGNGNRETGDDTGRGCGANQKSGEPQRAPEDRTDVTRICIKRAGRLARMTREAKLLREILCAPYGSKRMFAVRMMYWLSCPVYGRKRIWLTFDKLYKGGDCGEYFYKYMMTRKRDGITPGYIIHPDAKDLKRLRGEGYEPLIYHSLKQRLMYLHASMIFATHSSVYGFCGFSKWEIRFVQDRIRAVNTCIQHGLSVQDLRGDSNRIVNNNKRYYCASPCEVENLSKPEYDYGRDVLRLTGLARYDGLVNRGKKQILITPTWRAYIAMPSVMGSARPYNPDFVKTDYYRIFQSLLEDERLIRAVQDTGYEIIYLLHPVISAQKKDFHVRSEIRILQATEISYEQVLTESALMVTDYSGVQFDFAYMRKPVVYFHPPKLPPHYEEGGFNYETQGFGEICTETEELVRTLCAYMETGCALKPEYRKRQDDFFAFDDHENCRRIFEDALEYAENRKEG